MQAQMKQMQQQKIFRKALVVPAEHGSWSWLLVPFFVGLGVAGQLHVAALVTLTGGLSAFLMRQPATAWLRIRQGRGRRADEGLAAGWTLSFALLATLSLVALLALGRLVLLWLLPPLGLVLVLYLAVAQINRAQVRSLWMELAGAAGLAAMAPAAYAAATGTLDQTAWFLWGLLAAQNVLGALYVRLRIADTHGRDPNRLAPLLGHLLGLLLVAGSVAAGLLPVLVLLPFLGFLARALWAVAAPRPITAIKRFGFTEVGVEAVSGLLIMLGYVI